MDTDMYALATIALMVASFIGGMAIGVFIEKGAPQGNRVE